MYEVIESASKTFKNSDLPSQFHEHYSEGLKMGHAKVMKYFHLLKVSPLYYAAVILHPGGKFDYFENKWGRYDKGAWVKGVRSSFRALYKEYEANYEATHHHISSSEDESQPPHEIDPYDAFNRIPARKRRKTALACSDEYSEYFEYDDEDDQDIDDVLAWWEKKKDKYPVLYTMAMDILSIPGMSAEIERIFSAAGQMITEERNKLGPDTVKACQLQKHWKKGGLI